MTPASAVQEKSKNKTILWSNAEPTRKNCDGAATPELSAAKKENKDTPFWMHFMSGGMAGTIGAVITCPLEVVKTRFQSSHYATLQATPMPSISRSPIRMISYHIRGTFDALKSVYRNEGVFALWKGIGATVVGVMPSRAIYFSCYNKGKMFYSELNGGKETSLVHLIAAATAGMITATATNPIWLIKTRLQLQQSSKADSARNYTYYKNSWHCLRTVIRTEGVFALYQGLSASYLGVIEGTLQWVIYERLKRLVAEQKVKKSQLNGLSGEKNAKDWLHYFLIAAASKLIACVTTYPHEVLRTRLRQGKTNEGTIKYSGLIQAAKLMYKEEGAVAFYGGMTAHLLRVVPNSAIMFFCYEVFVYAFTKHHDSINRQFLNVH